MHLLLKINLILALMLVLIPCFAWSANRWISHRASDHLYERVEDVDSRAVAIVLGARVRPDGTPSLALEDRLHLALRLYEAGKVRRILVSGDHGQDGYDEVNAMHAWLVARGVPGEVVFLDHAGFRTFDTMERAVKVFEVKEAIICTQRFHLDRAVYLARSSGIDAIGVPADRRVYSAAHRDERREFLARTRALFDANLPWISPRYLGAPIPIEGDPSMSHDHKTRS